MTHIRSLIADCDALEWQTFLCGATVWPMFAWSCRLPADECETVASMFASAGLTWSQAAQFVDSVAKDCGWCRERGEQSDQYGHTADMMLGINKCNHILLATNPRVSDDEVMRDLPSVEDIISLSVTEMVPGSPGCIASNNHILFNWFLSCAAVSAKFGRHSEALAYAVAGLVPDFDKAGTTVSTSRVLLMTLQANALAALGQKAEAGVVFEDAAEEAHRSGLFLYEAFALRDFKVAILDDMGHGDHASRRLGAALRQLTGPAELLTPLLGGFDAAELMAMDDPEGGYEVVFEAEDPIRAALRQELQRLRLTELRQRAKEGGVDESTLDDAIDTDDPKGAIIEILLECEPRPGAADDDDAQLRAELQGLRVSALSKRAMSEGIDLDQIDAATDSAAPKEELIALLLTAAATMRVTAKPVVVRAQPRATAVRVAAKPVVVRAQPRTTAVRVAAKPVAVRVAAPEPAPATAKPKGGGTPCSTAACASIVELTAAIASTQLSGVDVELLKLEVWDDSFEEWVTPVHIKEIEDECAVRVQLLEAGGDADSDASGHPQSCSVLVHVDAAVAALRRRPST